MTICSVCEAFRFDDKIHFFLVSAVVSSLSNGIAIMCDMMKITKQRKKNEKKKQQNKSTKV